MAVPLNGNCPEEAHLNPDNFDETPAPKTKLENLKETLLRVYQNNKFVRYCAWLSVLILFLVLTCSIVYFVFFKEMNCPWDKTERVKLKSYCHHIIQKGEDICNYRYDPIRKECNKLGETCGLNMRFYLRDFKSHFGVCSCNYKDYRTLIEDSLTSNTTNCYYIFDQGPCKKGEWIVVDSDKLINSTEPSYICEESFCETELVPFLIKSQNGNEFKCVEVGSKSEHCPEKIEDYKIQFTSTSFYPECVHKNDKSLFVNPLYVGGSPISTTFVMSPIKPITPPIKELLPPRRPRGIPIG